MVKSCLWGWETLAKLCDLWVAELLGKCSFYYTEWQKCGHAPPRLSRSFQACGKYIKKPNVKIVTKCFGINVAFWWSKTMSFETVLTCCRASRGMGSTPDNTSMNVTKATLHNTNNERDEGWVCQQPNWYQRGFKLEANRIEKEQPCNSDHLFYKQPKNGTDGIEKTVSVSQRLIQCLGATD